MNEKIRKLLTSSIKEDILIGLHLLANTEDPMKIFRGFTEIVQMSGTRFDDARYQIASPARHIEEFYFKVGKEYYILVQTSMRRICECWEPYNKDLEIIVP